MLIQVGLMRRVVTQARSLITAIAEDHLEALLPFHVAHPLTACRREVPIQMRLNILNRL